MKNVFHLLGRCALATLVTFFLGILLSLPVYWVRSISGVGGLNLMAFFIAYLLLILILGLINFQLAKERGSLPEFWRVKWVKQKGRLVFMLIVLMLLLVLIHHFGLKEASTVSTREGAINSFFGEYPILAIIGMCLLGPICEELNYRSVFYGFMPADYLMSKMMIIIAVVINSLVFSAVHVPSNFEQALYYFVGSSIFSMGYFISKGDYRVSIAVHSFANTFMFVTGIWTM
ncbi:CPBP family intramembrane glutamic endopeptidase [Lactiplantibacillus fabifermentans]|nr:type II CAAX endopeptidase family protein [Lactiplantibacillus fabifermentans]ETY75531.1 hypothetical protein LFAB_01545 [Lactiplantibacillus fabifermentans T30PCM01]